MFTLSLEFTANQKSLGIFKSIFFFTPCCEKFMLNFFQKSFFLFAWKSDHSFPPDAVFSSWLWQVSKVNLATFLVMISEETSCELSQNWVYTWICFDFFSMAFKNEMVKITIFTLFLILIFSKNMSLCFLPWKIDEIYDTKENYNTEAGNSC